jgi:hypothetical protein
MESDITGSEIDWHSRNENCGAVETAGAEIGEGLVGLVEWIARGLGDDANLRHHVQEVDSVLPCEIGDRQKRALFHRI